jgi:hypothetical protein
MSWVVCEQTWVRPFAIPRPLVHKLGRQASFQHVDDVLAQHREEFEAVEVAAGSNVEALGGGVWRDDEVGACGEGVPVIVVSTPDTLLFQKDCDLPADTVLLHLEVRSVLAVEDVVCVGDVLLELSSHLPLRVIALSRRR